MITLIASSAWAVPIDKDDFEVVEALYDRVGILSEDIKIVEDINHLDIQVLPWVKVTPYNKNNKRLSSRHVLTNEDGRVIYLKIRQDDESKKLTSLSGIEKLEYLEVLDIYNHRITDLTPLSNLYSLKGLRLSTNGILDVTYLKNLRKLIYLFI